MEATSYLKASAARRLWSVSRVAGSSWTNSAAGSPCGSEVVVW
jgi:hypothetical protein